MRWKGLVVCSCFLGMMLGAAAQQSRITFYTSPRDAKLTLDGEQIGAAHDRRVFVGFNERKGITEHVFVVSAAGYEDAEVVVNHNLPERQVIRVDLERSLPAFELASGITVGFDKVVSGIPYSTKLDATTKWKYLFHDEIPLGERTQRIEEALERMQLHTPSDAHSSDIPDLPLRLVGRVDDLKLRRGTAEDNFNPYSTKTTATTTIAWSFVQPGKNDTLLSVENTSVFEMSTALINEGFFEAVVDNFMVMFGVQDSATNALHQLDASRLESFAAAQEAAAQEAQAAKQAYLDSIATARQADSSTAELAPDSTLIRAIDEGVVLPGIPNRFQHAEERDAVARRATVRIIDGTDQLVGTVLSRDGYIISATRIGEGAQAEFYNGILLDLEEVAYDEAFHLSLLKVDASGLTGLALAGDDDEEAEQPIYLWLPVEDRFEAARREAVLAGRQVLDGRRYLIANVPAQDAMPGAALVNQEGAVIGVVNDIGISESFLGLTGAVDARYIYHVFGLSYE